MATFSNIRQGLGNFIDYASTPLKKYGLPDFGISELVAGGNTINTGKRLAPQGYAETGPGGAYPQGPGPGGAYPIAGGVPQSVQQRTSQQSSGGGNGGGGGDDRITQLQKMGYLNPIQQQELNSLMQPAPQQPSIDFDALIAPALQALDEAVAPQQNEYQANISQIEGNTGRIIAGQKSALSEAERAAEIARQRQFQQGEGAVNEQRRMFAEQQQGLQSRYGGTTGTGRFAAELAGRQSTQNAAQIRQQVANAIQDIDTSVEKVRAASQMYISDAEMKASEMKVQAKLELDKALANIRIAKGDLMGKKAEMAANAVQFYQNQLQQINQANTAFKQNIFLQAQKAEQDLVLARQNAKSTVDKITFGVTGKKMLGDQVVDDYGFINSNKGTITPPTIGGQQSSAAETDPIKKLKQELYGEEG